MKSYLFEKDIRLYYATYVIILTKIRNFMFWQNLKPVALFLSQLIFLKIQPQNSKLYCF